MKICFILGTRPEIIKLYSLIKYCKHEYFIIHSGQHYSYNMDEVFFKELGLPNPKYNLHVGGLSSTQQIAKIIKKAESILLKELPDYVFVQGDTNTVVAGAIVANKLGIKVVHIEAGLRSGDRTMPEEINRIITDHISDYLFAPTTLSRENLLKEGVEKKKIFVVGNTIVDVLKSIDLLKTNYKNYALLTVHRQENTNNVKKLKTIIYGINGFISKTGIRVLFPIHPRTLNIIKKFDIDVGDIKLLEPLGFKEFLSLEKGAMVVFTDSGGVQEECCVFSVPCIVLRESTERPETKAVITGTCFSDIVREGHEALNKAKKKYDGCIGNGKAFKKIWRVLK